MARTGRTTVYNKLTTPEEIKKINRENAILRDDFISYQKGMKKSPGTIKGYKSDLDIFFVWVLNYLDNKDFTKITKREFARFQSYAVEELNWSSNRIRRVKSAISSLSNYIENILDEEHPEYRSLIRKIENPAKSPAREKSIFTLKEITDCADQFVNEGKIQIACCLMLCAASGRRREELSRFKVSYFDDANVENGLYKTPEKIKTKGRGADGKLLPVYVIKKIFKKYFDLWMEERERRGIESEWLFVNKDSDGKYVQVGIPTLDSWKTQINKKLGDDKYFYWHALRHMFVTQLKRSHIPDTVIKNIIGWDSIDMVGVYSDIDPDEEFGEYFDEDGIKEVAPGSIKDI